MNSELLQIVQDALSRPSPVKGYRNEAERLAEMQAEQFKSVVFETLKNMYGKDAKWSITTQTKKESSQLKSA